MSEPMALGDALEATVRAWSSLTGQEPPSALFCAEAHPLTPEVLCRRLDGHAGTHQSDGGDAWADWAAAS